MIKTIAILGATEKYASALAEGLASDCNRLLLFSDQQAELLALRENILQKNPNVSIEITDCASEASWQADIVVLAVCIDLQRLMSGSIADFVTQKTLLAFVSSKDDVSNLFTSNVLQQLLPHTHVVPVYLTEDQRHGKLFYASAINEAALEEAESLLISAGFFPELLNKSNSIN
ncbi:hypothetical protein [Daejeonella sp.]|uniref:hypothetical protein n=1 Tax=Daejeonella sp. TaxID=2805397 RepID=UPI0025B88E18|nr:hypothetical protein [Daejeonella sp.]